MNRLFCRLLPRRAAFYRMNQIQQIFFSIYIRRDYLKNYYDYERFLHQARLRAFSSMLKITSPQVDRLFEVVTALGSLRYQIEDFSTLEVCEKELRDLSDNISQQLNNSKGSIDKLLISIHAFEEIYRGALCVIAKDPLIFWIFIQNLYALYDELKSDG